MARRYRRSVVFVGTTNDWGWHRDESGGRRFWPIKCRGPVDIEWLQANREQLFAEAYDRYRRGGSWVDVPRDDQGKRVMGDFTTHALDEGIEAVLLQIRVYTRQGSNVAAAPCR